MGELIKWCDECMCSHLPPVCVRGVDGPGCPQAEARRACTTPCPRCGTVVYGMKLTGCFCGWRSDPEPPARTHLRLVPPPEDCE